LESRDEVVLPEDVVGDEPVGLLDREEAAQLVRGPHGVEARPDDRMEARIPEPLKRVVAYGRHREAVQPAGDLGGLSVRLEEVARAVVERGVGAGRRYPFTVGERSAGA
jgi:hypothetical protein